MVIINLPLWRVFKPESGEFKIFNLSCVQQINNAVRRRSDFSPVDRHAKPKFHRLHRPQIRSSISPNTVRPGSLAVFASLNEATISSFSRTANSHNSVSCASMLMTCRSSLSVDLRAYTKYLMGERVKNEKPAFGVRRGGQRQKIQFFGENRVARPDKFGAQYRSAECLQKYSNGF